MPLTTFSAPGFLQDFSPAQARAWSSLVDFWLNREIKNLKGGDANKPVHFFNELREPVPDGAAEQPIPWDGFPRALKLQFDGDELWEAAQPLRSHAARSGGILFSVIDGAPVQVDFGYRNQDEYLEWRETPGDQPGSISKITFTCESPEYWTFIAGGTRALVREEDLPEIAETVEGDPDMLLRLYRKYVSPDVQVEDLYHQHEVRLFVREDGEDMVFLWARQGSYNPYNKWNTTDGIMHLTHPANTLRAEINLAARGTVLRKNVQGELITDEVKLICCSGYGAPNRFSDPSIGSEVNSLSRGGASVTLRDPVGLYINRIDKAAFEGPNEVDVSDAWSIVDNRGAEGMILRAEFGIPEGRGFTVDQVLVDGQRIKFGGQAADKIGMVLTGKAHDFNLPELPTEACTHHCCTSPFNADLLTVLEKNQECRKLPPEDRWAETFGDLIPAPAPPQERAASSKAEVVTDRFDHSRFAETGRAGAAFGSEEAQYLLSKTPGQLPGGGTRNEGDDRRAGAKE